MSHKNNSMIQAKLPENEDGRLKALKSYQILDTLSEKELDDLTALASQICETPISLITLIDEKRQWFKSRHGMSTTETPREYAFCAHAILNPNEILEVEDSRQDERFFDNPLVADGNPPVVFYAGVPLVNGEGYSLGTLCVVDNKPKKLNEAQLISLKALANQVVLLFELRRKNIELVKLTKELEAKNEGLTRFSYVVSHDIKSPLSNIESFTSILEDEIDSLSEEGKLCVDYIKSSAIKLKNIVDGLLSYYKQSEILKIPAELIDLNILLKSITDLLKNNQNIDFEFPEKPEHITANKMALEQVFLNIINNAIKYNDKPIPKISISFNEDKDYYNFSVKDNGIGIEAKHLDGIFEIFTTLGIDDRSGNKGTGIGLASVKKIVAELGGKISVESTVNVGTNFLFSINK